MTADDREARGRDRADRTPRIEHIETLRAARVALLGGTPPAAPGPAAPGEVWYVLHGYRQLAERFVVRFAGIASSGRLIVAPEGASRFYLQRSEERFHSEAVGASWMTREDREHEIRDYVRYLDRVARVVEGRAREKAEARRVLLGFSQGAHTAARWAVLGRDPPSRMVLWGAPLPPDLPPEAADRLRRTELILVRGESDALRRSEAEEREEAWLEGAGLAYRILKHPGGHDIDRDTLSTLAGEG